MKTIVTILTASALAGIASIASAQSSMQDHGGMPAQAAMPMGIDAAEMQKKMNDMMSAPDDSASTKDFKAAEMRMMQNMASAYTGNADVDFRMRMIPHHQGAIDVAKVALKHVKDPETKRLAQKIIDDQEKEIAEMQAWLKKNPK